MKNLILFLGLICVVFGCTENDLTNTDSTELEILVEARGNKVDICHNGHIIRVNINALPAHQAHGDAVDIDGDGYFDKDNVCGPTDCDDSNAELTENCCPSECFWCDYIDLMDFNEHCGNRASDHFQCQTRTISQNQPCTGILNSYSTTYTLVDYDEYNDCDTDDERDLGVISVTCNQRTYCNGDYYEACSIFIRYQDRNQNSSEWIFVVEQVDIDTGSKCQENLINLAESYGFEIECDEQNYSNSGALESIRIGPLQEDHNDFELFVEFE